jgi:hypothetical protein
MKGHPGGEGWRLHPTLRDDGCGGGYASGPMLVRSARRYSNSADSRMKGVGLRLARTLWRKP